MHGQIRLGRIFGIEIRIHYSWFLIALLIATSLSAEFHGKYPKWTTSMVVGMSVVTAVLFFVSLLLHELAHSLVAGWQGLPVREITLFALGGVSQIEKEPVSARNEFWMAFVGPLTSAAIGAACIGVVHAVGGTSPAIATLKWLGYINLMLAGFNMVPGYPLDGGRVLRAVIWWITGNPDRSTEIAANTGQAVAFGLIALGIFQYFLGAGLGGLWTAFIGWFLLQAARESRARASLTHALAGVRVEDVMSRDCPTVDGWLNVENFVNTELLRTGRRFFLVIEKGETTGLLTPHEIKGVERNRWPYTTVAEIMRPISEVKSATLQMPAEEALEQMSRDDLNQLPVLANGKIEGLVSRATILAFLRARAEWGRH